VWRCACAVQGSTTTGQAQAAAERAQGSSANGGAAVQVGGDTSTHHFACMHAGALLISRGARGSLLFLQAREAGSVGLGGGGGGGPTHTATHGQSRGSSTLFDAPKSTVPTHPRQLTNGIKALAADVI